MKETKLEEEFTKNIQEIKKLKGYNNKSISLRSFNKLVQLSAGTEVLNIVTFLIALKATVIYICVNIILIYTVKHLLQKSEGMKNFLSFLFRSPPLALVCIMTLIVYIERSKIYQLSHLFQNPVVIFSLLCFVAIRYRKKIHTAICI